MGNEKFAGRDRKIFRGFPRICGGYILAGGM